MVAQNPEGAWTRTLEARERRRRVVDRVYRAATHVFFLSLLIGVVAFAVRLARMVGPTL